MYEWKTILVVVIRFLLLLQVRLGNTNLHCPRTILQMSFVRSQFFAILLTLLFLSRSFILLLNVRIMLYANKTQIFE